MKLPDIGHYYSPPLETDFVLKVSLCEKIRIMLTHLSLELPSPHPMLMPYRPSFAPSVSPKCRSTEANILRLEYIGVCLM